MGVNSTLSLSHLELCVKNVARMEQFYTEVLGFVATDRGKGEEAMVFLSKNPGEHHQIVLTPGGDGRPGALDHMALRVDTLDALRRVFETLKRHDDVSFETVSHGSTWSIYIKDPEGNRVEVFADTPWHVAQPVRFAVDLELPDDALLRQTEDAIRERAGFSRAEDWYKAHRKRISS